MSIKLSKIILTKEGVTRLKERLKFLEEVEREKIANDIREAQSFGDISENAEYDEARSRQELLEQEVAELKYIISHATIVSPKKFRGKITIGSKVKLKFNNEVKSYEIVGDREADPSSGKISYKSPWGTALLGKTKGEKVEVETPQGKKSLQILDVA
jgi:transcription elongation factor GreA